MDKKAIGPSFWAELAAAGLVGLPFSWDPSGSIYFDPGMTSTQIDAVKAVYAAHDPTQLAPPVVPEAVTRYQARAALMEAGLLAEVNAFFAGLSDGDMGKLAWNEAPTVRRDSEALAAGAHALGLVDAQIDALFVRANEIQ